VFERLAKPVYKPRSDYEQGVEARQYFLKSKVMTAAE
jgi:hypothetical protein